MKCEDNTICVGGGGAKVGVIEPIYVFRKRRRGSAPRAVPPAATRNKLHYHIALR